ncbi:uncharacterized protein LOC125035218 [Penaeus chinensis]|uniref:uncharacterized protein LOC125035218 n=1 Tax=Penaeus chinensis TaxID=139456 RepID=UPI001FB5E39C|nr:uncharacterized protein LOC125035218 [Penaeus chinensis]
MILPETPTPEPSVPATTIEESSARETELRKQIAELSLRTSNLADADESISNFNTSVANTRKRRSASLAIGQDGQDITIDPYCGVNAEDSLAGNTSTVLLAVLTDLSEEVSNLTTDQISCFSQLLEKFTAFIENGSIIIDPLFKSSIINAANVASDAVEEERSDVQALITDLQKELDILTGESTTTAAPEPEPEPGPEPLPVPAPRKTRLRLVIFQQVKLP